MGGCFQRSASIYPKQAHLQLADLIERGGHALRFSNLRAHDAVGEKRVKKITQNIHDSIPRNEEDGQE